MAYDMIDGQGLYGEHCGPPVVVKLQWSSLNHRTEPQNKTIVMTLKRITDFFGALLGLMVLAPLFFLIAFMIKWDSPGPVLYRQTRIGLRDHPFVLLKFRSMYQNAEVDGVQWADISDCRITRVGRWLRKGRFDELPQLLNVLKGEMSLVGPRPERPSFVQELRDLIPLYDLRHTVRPGMTGWAQTRLPYAASVEDSYIKLQYDLYYVKKLSLWLDFLILIRTIQVVILGSGAR